VTVPPSLPYVRTVFRPAGVPSGPPALAVGCDGGREPRAQAQPGIQFPGTAPRSPAYHAIADLTAPRAEQGRNAHRPRECTPTAPDAGTDGESKRERKHPRVSTGRPPRPPSPRSPPRVAGQWFAPVDRIRRSPVPRPLATSADPPPVFTDNCQSQADQPIARARGACSAGDRRIVHFAGFRPGRAQPRCRGRENEPSAWKLAPWWLRAARAAGVNC